MTLHDRCMDPALSVRRQAMVSLTSLLHERPACTMVHRWGYAHNCRHSPVFSCIDHQSSFHKCSSSRKLVCFVLCVPTICYYYKDIVFILQGQLLSLLWGNRHFFLFVCFIEFRIGIVPFMQELLPDLFFCGVCTQSTSRFYEGWIIIILKFTSRDEKRNCVFAQSLTSDRLNFVNSFIGSIQIREPACWISWQGSHGSWKTWKVLEFYYGIFQDWKVLEKDHWSWKVLEWSVNSSKKYEMYGRQ